MLFWYFLFSLGRLPLLTSVLYCFRIWLSLSVYFQGVDYGGLTPVRYMRLKHNVSGLCVSGAWLVITEYRTNTTRLYSLPDLTLHHQVTVEWCKLPRADNDGRVYVPALSYITVVEITDSGNMTAIRNITLEGQDLSYPSVAVGPQPGLLCVTQQYPARLWLVNATDGRVKQALPLPQQCVALYSVAAMDSGQLMISYTASWPWKFSLAVYRSMSESPTVLTSLSSVGDLVWGLVGSGNLFLALYSYTGDLLVVSANGTVLHTVDAVNGKLGIFLHGITDLAVWQDCVWLGFYHGDLVLLCANWRRVADNSSNIKYRVM